MKSPGWMVMCLLAVFLLAASSSWAQGPPTDCEDGSIGSCLGELLDIQMETINEVEDMLMEMEAMKMFSFGLAAEGSHMRADLFARIDTLRNEHARAMDAKGAVTDFEFDEVISQGDMEKGKNCKFSDKNFFDSLDGEDPPGWVNVSDKFGDGNCNTFMANDEDDPSGTKVKVNERKENMCERVCEGKMNQMGKSKERFVGSMLDALSTARGANQALFAQKARVSELGFRIADLRLERATLESSTATAGTGDPCDPGIPGPSTELILAELLNAEKFVVDLVIVALDVVLVAGNIVTEFLDFTTDVMENPCRQTGAGFNASVACSPLDVVFHISAGIFGVVGGVKDLLGDGQSLLEDGINIALTASEIIASFSADDTQLCSKQIRDEFVGPDGKIVILQRDVTDMKADVAGLKVTAGETSDALEEMAAEMAFLKILLEETRDLLLTPAGRRQGFQP